MKLYIDGFEVTPKPDTSLLDIIKDLGLITGKLSSDPLVAKIAGDVFTLNYVPVRTKDISADKETERAAMAASGGVIKLIRYGDPRGSDAYRRTAQFVIFLAMRRLYPSAAAKMNCTGRSLSRSKARSRCLSRSSKVPRV